MAASYTHASQSIQRLLVERPDKAADILATCYRKHEEVKDEIDSILQLLGAAQAQPSHLPTNSAIPVPSRSSVRGHTRSSSSQSAILPSSHRGVMQPDAGFTPPASSASRSSKGASSLGETILLIDANEEGIEHYPVILRTAEIEFSLIREDIVNERILSAMPIVEDCHHVVRLPDNGKEVRIFESITLTWRRRKSASTHRTKFFLVSRDHLCTDVLLGYKDSGKNNTGSPTNVARPFQQRQGYDDVQHRQEVHSPSEMSPSFHLSNLEPTPSQARRPHLLNRLPMENFLATGQPQGWEGKSHHPVSISSAATVRNVNSTRINHAKPNSVYVEVPDISSETPIRRLRLSLKWDQTPINLWLNLDGPSEAFCHAFKEASKRKQVQDWSLVVIYLKTEPHSPDDSAYRLSLGTEELDADWETTVGWLDENKRIKAPHIHGVIELEGV